MVYRYATFLPRGHRNLASPPVSRPGPLRSPGRTEPAHSVKQLFTAGLMVFLIGLAVGSAAADVTRIAVLPFLGNNLDGDIARQAGEKAREIISEDRSFALIPADEIDRWLAGGHTGFLQSDEIRKIMKELGASIMMEGSIGKAQTDRTDIQIRISTRSSTWRPPTSITAMDVASAHAVSRTESLVRQFLNDYAGEQSMERFFQSALIPGLGQYREGQNTKASIFFLGTVGCVATSFLLPDGDSYRGTGKVELKGFLSDPVRWYIGDKAVSYEEAQVELDKRAQAEDSRDEARFAKFIFRSAGLAMYVYNLYDIMKTARKYDPAKGSRFNWHLSPMSPERLVSVDWHLNL